MTVEPVTPPPPAVCFVAVEAPRAPRPDAAAANSLIQSPFFLCAGAAQRKFLRVRACVCTRAKTRRSPLPRYGHSSWPAELSLQMASGRALNGSSDDGWAPIKAGGMLQPLGWNTECIINRAWKKRKRRQIFSAERLKQ